MKNLLFCGLALIAQVNALHAQQVYGQEPFVHTYSIVAIDQETGEMGVAVQSHWFSVGQLVVWGEAGVGVVATQSFVDPNYGPEGLRRMAEGQSPEDALQAMLAADEGAAVRQVAFLNAEGQVAAHTGSSCIAAAGHQIGEDYSVQANLMTDDAVWPAMAEAFEQNKELPLAERLIATLEAAQAAGGDIRGKQSAAILIVAPQSSGKVWEDRLIDLRVEDHPTPVAELKRLVQLQRAYDHMNRGDLAMEKGDVDGAMEAYGAAEALFPDNLEMKYWHAVALANNGQVDEAIPLFQKVFSGDANWRVLTPRLVQNGLLDVSEEEMRRILLGN